MPKNIKHITKTILTFALALSLKANAQEVRVIDNKGTIQNVNSNRVFTQATDPNPSLPTPPITVQGDIWFNSSVTPNEMNVWNGTSWVTVSSQNNAWLKANSTDVPTSIDDNIYTNGRIGINDDNPDFAIKVITQSEGIDQFLRFETDDSDDFLEISNTTGTANTLAGGFIGGTRSANKSSLNFFGDSEVSDDIATSEPIIKFFTRIGSNNSSAFGSGATTVVNRPLFDFINHNDSKLKILANGNTGIDVDTPTEKLDINGQTRIRTINTGDVNTDELVVADATGVLKKITPSSLRTQGDIKYGIQTTDHGGWYLLDGRLLTSLSASAQTAAAGLGLIGNLPDATDRVLKQSNGAQTIGTTGGQATTVLTQNNLPNVTFTGTTSTDGEHTHTFSRRTRSRAVQNNAEDSNLTFYNRGGSTTTSNDGNHNHTVSVNSGGNDESFERYQPYLVVNTFIYLGL